MHAGRRGSCVGCQHGEVVTHWHQSCGGYPRNSISSCGLCSKSQSQVKWGISPAWCMTVQIKSGRNCILCWMGSSGNGWQLLLVAHQLSSRGFSVASPRWFCASAAILGPRQVLPCALALVGLWRAWRTLFGARGSRPGVVQDHGPQAGNQCEENQEYL